MTMRTALLALLALGAGLSACSAVDKVNPFSRSEPGDQLSEEDRARRVSFLSFDDTLQVDEARASLGVTLPPPIRTSIWPNEGGFPDHAPQHLAAAEDLRRAWRRNIGQGSSRKARLSAPPIVADGKVFVVDADNEIVAYDSQDGRRLWRSQLRSGDRRDREFRSGGVAYGDGRVFVSLGFGAVAAFDANTGREVWRAATSGPMHSPPTAADGRVFAVSFDNEVFAFDSQTGEVLWTYQSLSEPARILTASSPAVQGEVVIAPSASGELTALRVDNGRVLWSDALTRSGRTTALSALNDIAGSPVIYDGMVFAVSQSGLLAAFDLRTGQRLWTQPAGGIHMPWVVGDYLYIMTTDGHLACLSRLDGVTIWIQDLPQYKRPQRRRGRISWAGPVLAGGRLLLVSSEGEMMSLSATTGDQLDRYRLGDNVFIPPIVADATVYVLTDDANLIAYR
jgi:outer membrane protein assembly factor BamB